jgi:hypothetical protein
MQGASSLKRSDFVTILAWLFIALSGFAVFISLMQNLFVQFIFPLEKIAGAMQTPEASRLPPVFRFMFKNIRFILLVFLAVTTSTLIASLGLLHRKNWARITFIGLMALGILWNLAGIILQQTMFTSFPQNLASRNIGFPVNFNLILYIIKAATAVIALGLSVLFGWIIRKLISSEIRAEFSS